MLDALRDAACRPRMKPFKERWRSSPAKSFGKQSRIMGRDDGGFVYTPAGEGESKWKAKAARCGPTAQ